MFAEWGIDCTPAPLGRFPLRSFSEWIVVDLKYDNCGVPANWTDECFACVPDSTNPNDYLNGTCQNTTGICSDGYDYSQSLTVDRYTRMRDALLAQNHTILYSLCDWGQANVKTWGNETGNSWRMSGDITGRQHSACFIYVEVPRPRRAS